MKWVCEKQVENTVNYGVYVFLDFKWSFLLDNNYISCKVAPGWGYHNLINLSEGLSD